MNTSLKSLLNEADINGRRVQVYLDMDGVLVNFNDGFRKISGGFTAEEFAEKKFNGDSKKAKREFWRLINLGGANWWANLDKNSDADALWNFFKRYNPIILTAGKGNGVVQGKTAWVRKHIGSNVKVIVADRGEDKWKYITRDEDTVHVLIDDLQRNIDTWNDPDNGRVAIIHTSSAESIRKFSEMYIKQ